MTYSEFIDRVNDKVRTTSEWPASSDATSEQVQLSWIAALAVSNQVPFSAFSSGLFTNDSLSDPDNIYEALDLYDLPEDVFEYREDLGIVSIEMDDVIFQLDEMVPLSTIRNKSRNALYKDAVLFHIDLDNRRHYAFGASDVRLRYLTNFSAPDTEDVEDTDYPFEGTYAERAASIVAMHVLGELTHEPASAQFQSLLTRLYTPQRAAVEEPQAESS